MRRPNYRKFIVIVTFLLSLYFFLVYLLIYFESADPAATIKSFGVGIWYTLVTLTTVGYGDYTPLTLGGRVIGLIFVGLSLTVYGLIIGQIASFMNTIRENQKLGFNGTDFANHTVVIGWNQFGKDVVDQLVGVYKKVAIVTNVINDVDLIRETYDKKLVYVIFSDMANFELISKTNIHQASAVFINLKDDTEKLVYILNMKKHFGNLKFVVTLDNSSLKQTFHSAGTTYTVTKNEISSKLVASYIFEPDVAEYSENIMSYAETDDDHDIKEYKVIGRCAYCKKDYEYAFIHLKKQYNSVLIGISKLIEGKRRLFKNPSEPLMVEEGDYLLMITTKKADVELQKLFQIEEGYMGD